MTIPATTAFPTGAPSPADGSDAAARRDGGLWARNPRTGEVDYFVVPPTPDDVTALAARLRGAQRGWRDLGVDGRIAVMLRWADAISRDAELIAAAEGTDTARV